MDSDSVKNALITVVSLLNGAYALFKSSKTYKKRLLLKTMFSNCFLDGEKLVTTWVDAVSIVGKIRFYPKWQCLQSSDNYSQRTPNTERAIMHKIHFILTQP